MMTQSMLQPPITFVTKPPVIDGALTTEKARLPARRSAHTFKMDPGSPDLDLSDRLGYGTGFLYLYIHVDAETFVCRDRGLQNGDGFVLTLAKPQPRDAPSSEFYMLGFWPQDEVGQPFARLLWGRKGDFPFTPLSSDTQFVVKAHGGKSALSCACPGACPIPITPGWGTSVSTRFLSKRSARRSPTSVWPFWTISPRSRSIRRRMLGWASPCPRSTKVSNRRWR